MVAGERELWSVFSFKGTNPIAGPHPHDLLKLVSHKPHFQLPSCWEFRFQTRIWGGHEHSVPSQHPLGSFVSDTFRYMRTVEMFPCACTVWYRAQWGVRQRFVF